MSATVHFDPNLPWYIARSAGFVAWGLVSASVIWGMAFAGRLARRRPPAAWVLDLHRFLGGLAVVFTGVHLLGLTADRYTNFGLEHILVPFTSTYRPRSVAWGVIAFWLVLAIEGTSLLMHRLPRRAW
jgi:hypothetical protein